MERVIGLDISKHSAEVAMLHLATGELKRGRFAAEPQAIRKFADGLGPDDRVALESCTNAFAFHRLLCQHAGQVVVSNPLKTRVIAEAKVKTDKVDAEILARLLAADFLPPVWVPDAAIDQLRHLVSHRQGLVTQRTQAKNRIHAILHRNLIAPDFSDLFGKTGRAFLARVELPQSERCLLDADLRTIDFLGTEIGKVEKRLAETLHEDPDVRRLMTIPGIALTSAAGMKAAIGDVRRFRTSSNLVSYFGLNPSVYQSGLKGYTGHISRRGRSHARAICIEAAHQLSQVSGPFHAFFQRLRHRKPHNVAITAVARKLVAVIWQMLTREENYRYAAPAKTRAKLNRLHRLATGESAPRTRKLPKDAAPEPDPDPDPGRRGEDEYVGFIRDRFGDDGPRGIDHPNSPRISKGKKNSRNTP